MSNYSKDLQRRLRESAQEQRFQDQVEDEVQLEVEQFYQQMYGQMNLTRREEELARVQTRQMVIMLRGFKGRIEQLGDHVMKMSAIAQKAWNMTNVATDVWMQQGFRARKSVNNYNEYGGIRCPLDADAFGFKDADEVNRAFQETHDRLVEEAKANPKEWEDQGSEILSNTMKDQQAKNLEDLPGVQDLLTVKKH